MENAKAWQTIALSLFEARKYNRDVALRRESFVSLRNTEEKSISDEQSSDSTFLISLEHVYVHVPREISERECEKEREKERQCIQVKGSRSR